MNTPQIGLGSSGISIGLNSIGHGINGQVRVAQGTYVDHHVGGYTDGQTHGVSYSIRSR